MTASTPAMLQPLESGRIFRVKSVARIESIAAFALGFFAFLPYPAFPVGENTSIQLGTLVTLVMLVPLFFVSWKKKPYYFYPLFLVPLLTSTIKVVVTQQPGLDFCLKSVATWAIPALTMLAAIYYAPRAAMQILTGIACATLLHVLVACWQEYVFLTGGEFPLLFLYVNPSFYSVPDQAELIVRYIQRPFGLFSEPSAMSSSLAPWVLLWIAELCGLIRFPRHPTRLQRTLFSIAAAGGLLLIISSRSGHAMVTLAAVLLFGAIWLLKARATARNYFAMVLVFGVVLPLAVWLTFMAVGDRVVESTGANQSWQDRSNSLIDGFELWAHGNRASVVFGLGNGLSAQAIKNAYGLDAVWSVLLTHIYETGLVGATVLFWYAVHLWRVWKTTKFSSVFVTILLVWLVGITVTTSYNQLLPIWLTLGFFIVWPSVFPSLPSDVRKKRIVAATSGGVRPVLLG